MNPNPFAGIAKVVGSWGNADDWRAFDAHGTFLCTLSGAGVTQVLASHPEVKVEIEGAAEDVRAVPVFAGAVLVLQGFEVYRAGPLIEVLPDPALEARVEALEDTVNTLMAELHTLRDRIG